MFAQKEVYTNLSLDITELSAILHLIEGDNINEM